MQTRHVLTAVMLCALIWAPFVPAQAPDRPWWRPDERPTAAPRRPSFPGVLIEQLPRRPQAIQQAETSVAAFVGATASGPTDSPVLVSSFARYQAQFGGLDPGSPVSYAVRLFFDNGGSRAWIVRTDPAGLPGGSANATGIYALDAADPVNIVCVPEVSAPAVLAAAEKYCEQRGAFLIIDPPSTAATPAAVSAWLVNPGGPPRTRDCATYFPWLQVASHGGTGPPRRCGPSGAAAGVFARTDAARGVWKAPAGTGADVRGISGLSYALTSADIATLNTPGINGIRALAGVGTVVWGARTLSSDPEWKYVPVRRMTLMIEQSVDAGTQWVVFEPNEEPTWTQVRAQIEGFLQDLWRRGALQGAKADEAYFVRCGLGTTMTAADVAAGRMHILVGFAPLKPAEFIVLTVTHQVPTP